MKKSKKEPLPELSSEGKSAISKIEKIRELQENWDSYGAEKISEISIQAAQKFIQMTDSDELKVYFTAPGVNGDVLVEYRLDENTSAEIYFNPDGSNEMLLFDEKEDCEY